VPVELQCNKNGQYEVVQTMYTDVNGSYKFEITKQTTCRICVKPNDDDYTFSPPTGSDGCTSSSSIYYGNEPNWPVGIYRPLPSIGGLVFYDSNRNGLQNPFNPNEQGLPGQTVELHCSRSGVLVREATASSDADGTFLFEEIRTGICRIKVVRKQNNEFSLVVIGGNMIGKDGWSKDLTLNYKDHVDLIVGMYETTPEANCDPLRCPKKEIDPVLGYHDCGWGIWNDCNCEVRVTFLNSFNSFIPARLHSNVLHPY